jgi:hypothetical protein
MKTIENEGFFANARTALEKEVNQIARFCGFIGKKETIPSEEFVPEYADYKRVVMFYRNNQKAGVSIMNCTSFFETNSRIIFPTKELEQLIKTTALMVVAELFKVERD